MIHMKCPECGAKFSTIAGELTVILGTRMSVVPTDAGIKQGVQSPMKMKAVAINQPPSRCEECGATIQDWELVVSCDNCGRNIREVCDKCSGKTSPRRMVRNHLCWPSHTIRCPACWERHDASYCEECCHNNKCHAYKHMKGE